MELILQKLFTGINGATSKINNSSRKDLFQPLEEAQTRNLGKIAHTLKSIKNRSDKTDTWAIIFLCLFIDLLVPLAIYVLLRKKGHQFEDKSLQGKIKPASF